MITSYIFARTENHPVDEKFELPRLWISLRRALIPLMIPLFVLGSLIGGFVTPTEAAAVGVLAALVFGWIVQRDLGFSKVYELAATSVRQTSVVMMIIAGSAVLGQFLANEQIPQQIASALGDVTDSFVLRMLMINLFLLFLGMFLHASAAIIVVIPMLIPLSREMGIDPVHFGVIVCLNLGIGQQTPPVASVLLTVCSATGLSIEDVMSYCKWFILAMFIVLMIVSFLPATALYLV